MEGNVMRFLTVEMFWGISGIVWDRGFTRVVP